MLKEILWVLMTAFLVFETMLLLLNNYSIRRNLNNNIFKDVEERTQGRDQAKDRQSHQG